MEILRRRLPETGYNPENIKLIDKGFYQVLEVPVRGHKEGRDLIEVSEEFFAIKRAVEYRNLPSVYSLEVKPHREAGNHYHPQDSEKPKFEICQALNGILIVHLEDPLTRKMGFEILTRNEETADGEISRLVVLRPGIAHSFENRTDQEILYWVRSTSNCDPREEITYKVHKKPEVDEAFRLRLESFLKRNGGSHA